MTSAVIGLGETGGALYEVLSEVYPHVGRVDIKDWEVSIPAKYDIINICIPYSEDFVKIAEDYRKLFSPKLIIIHSTVPIGTTSKIKDAVHSPILGRHFQMKHDIRTFMKWIGGERAGEASDYLGKALVWTKCVPTSEETEAMKLMCLATYGASIAMAQYKKDICDTYGFSYDDVQEWDRYYNAGVDYHLRRPILSSPEGHIGGHCVVQNAKVLNEQHPNPILGEILKYA
jgi:UDP-N-acetyl-D-mannosaminuronate dehydrogenase